MRLNKHESYGKLKIHKFNGGGLEFFGSDLSHSSGIEIVITGAKYGDRFASDHVFSEENIIRIHLSSNQFLDAITSEMNTDGVPCTLKNIVGKTIPQVSHIEDRKEKFSNNMDNTFQGYFDRIDEILNIVESAKIPIKKKKEIIFEIGILKSHIKSNTVYVMDTFNESMDKTVTEAKHSVANYIDHKINSLGIELMRKELSINIEPKKIDQG